MDSIEDENIEMSIVQLMTSSSVITAGIFSIIIVFLSGLVLVQRNRYKIKTAPDYTDEIMHNLMRGHGLKKILKKRVDNLKLVGYSPEVAHAIVEKENNLLDEK